MIRRLKRALSLTIMLPIIRPFDFRMQVTPRIRLADGPIVPPFVHMVTLAGAKLPLTAIILRLDGLVTALLNVTVMIVRIVFTFCAPKFGKWVLRPTGWLEIIRSPPKAGNLWLG
jgi:hypothetical protein